MRRVRLLAAAALVALAACSSSRIIATNGVFTPTVLVRKPETGAYVDVRARRADGSFASYADVLEIVVPWRNEDPLVAPPVLPDDGIHGGPRLPGLVIARAVADERGAAALEFPVGPMACAYAYTSDAAGAGEPMAASLITRPENVFGYVIPLVPAVHVRGDVVGADGRPAAGAIVRAALRTDQGKYVVLMTTCAANGAFRFPPVPVGGPGWSDVAAFRADAADGASVRREVAPAELRAGPLRLVLAR